MSTMISHIKIWALTITSVIIVSCLGVNEEDLAGNFYPPEVSVSDVTLNNETVYISLNGSYKLSSASTKVAECGFYYSHDSEFATSIKVVADNNSENYSACFIPDYFDKEYFNSLVNNSTFMECIDDLMIDFNATRFYIGEPLERLLCLNDAAEYVQELAGEEANIIFGAMYDDTKTDEATITVIATGLHNVGGTASKFQKTLSGTKVPPIQNMEKYEAPVVPTPKVQELDLGLANPAPKNNNVVQPRTTGTVPNLQTPRTPTSQVKEQSIKIPTFLKK